eukprot:8244743-Pyramimonas_sp.AAC.1
MYFLLAKAGGGTRPIGLLSTGVRLVERVHAGLFLDWEREIRRDYDFAAPGGGSEDAMWQQMLIDEGAQPGETSGTA